jgi:hypothetical protein
MKELDTFHGDHFLVHISKDYPRNNDKLKNHPYEIIISSKFVYAPCNKDELLKLADFIYKTIGEK